MKKTILLLFAMVLCSLHLQAQKDKTTTESPRSNSRTAKSAFSSGNLNVESNQIGATITVENQNDSDYSSLSFFNELGQFQGEIGIGNTNAINSGNLIFSSNSADYVFSKSTVDSSNESMRITSSGNVGIGTSTPSEKLNVNGKIAITADTDDEMVIINGDTYRKGVSTDLLFGTGGDNFIMASKEGSDDGAGIYGDGNAVTIWSPGDGNPGQPAAYLYICDEDNFSSGIVDDNPYNDGALRAYVATDGMWTVSDRNKKENIKIDSDALSKITQLNTYTYTYKQNLEEEAKNIESREVVGIMAQELEQVIPQAVDTNDFGDYFVNYNQVTPVLIGAVKELKEENDELKTRLAQLEAAVEVLTRE